MGWVASLLEVPEPAASPAARFSPGGRLAAAATLVLGAGFQLLAFIVEPANDETIDRLRWVADHPDRANLAKLCDVLAMPFLIGTALVYVLLSRERSPRLAYAAGTLSASAWSACRSSRASRRSSSASPRTAASIWRPLRMRSTTSRSRPRSR